MAPGPGGSAQDEAPGGEEASLCLLLPPDALGLRVRAVALPGSRVLLAPFVRLSLSLPTGAFPASAPAPGPHAWATGPSDPPRKRRPNFSSLLDIFRRI